MRDIKFRAWDGRSMQFGGFSIHATGKLEPCQGLSRLKGDSIIMQFTGLTDKNGVEVYEGDILAFHVDWAGQPNKEVIFDNGFHSYILLSGQEKDWVAEGSNHFKYWSTDEDNIYLLHEADNYEIEVIGNIHQNPELLERKQ